MMMTLYMKSLRNNLKGTQVVVMKRVSLERRKLPSIKYFFSKTCFIKSSVNMLCMNTGVTQIRGNLSQFFKLSDVLVRSRFRPVILCAGIENDFLQICVREIDRDSLRFHWVEATNNDKIRIYRFARLMFELTQSPFV